MQNDRGGVTTAERTAAPAAEAGHRVNESFTSGSYPPAPSSVGETGLRRELVTELVMKTLYFSGESTGQEISRQIKLSYSILEEIFGYLRTEKFIEVRGLDGHGKNLYRYQMTEAGRYRTREFIERSSYVGPAPVTLEDYTRWVRQQSVLGIEQEPEFLRRGLAHLVMSEELLNALGPAVLSGRSIFLYGPPGNGKTVISEGIAAAMKGAIFVPHAIEVDGHIIKVFDYSNHQPIELKRSADEEWLDSGVPYDARWVYVKRPTLITGGELTLPMLDLQFNTISRYYEAPFQVKANGGVFVIDDFGRQLVKPHDLLNRWIVPLEKREDYLTLHTGKKFPVPFDSLIIFSTNLNPWDLVDEAFLRRIRYKIPIDNPTREQYEQLFERICQARGIEYRESAVEFVFNEYYDKRGYAPRFCHPRDLVDHIGDAYRYYGGGATLYHKAVVQACESYFLENPFDLAEKQGERPASLE
jgi:predicted ATPase with chaperone activity